MADGRTSEAVASRTVSPAANFRVLLAYNGSDHDTVVEIYNELKRRGFSPWIDSRNHRPGTDWRIGFTSALEHASAAIVFIGPNGLGPWQTEEIPSIHTQCVQGGVNAIPVLLPGGEMSKVVDMLFAARTKVVFRDGPMDREALDNLEFGITGHNPRDRHGRFEILAEVANGEPNCFLAVSHATSREIYELMLDAAVDANLIVKQPREFAPEAHNVYSPDVVLAIRSATVILADGTPDPATKKQDADVMYEIGLAEAFAKPIVFVSTPRSNVLPLEIFNCAGNCGRIEYDPDEVNFAGPLREEMASRLRKIREGLRPPQIVPDNNLGLRVAYSEMVQHRAVFWKPFEQIIHYGLTIKRVFAEILKHAHKMQQIIDLAHADAKAARPNCTLEASLRQFRAVYDQFCVPHMKDFEISQSWSVARTEAVHGFGVLHAIASETDDANRSIQSMVQNAFQFFEILETYLEEYSRAHAAVLTQIENPTTQALRQVIHLHTHTQRLVQNAELVPVNACEMMFQLLELIGMRNELGGLSHVSSDA